MHVDASNLVLRASAVSGAREFEAQLRLPKYNYEAPITGFIRKAPRVRGEPLVKGKAKLQ